MIRTTLVDAQEQLVKLFDAALRGEEVVIVDNGDGSRLVKLVAEVETGRGAVFGSGKGLFRMADDFDDPLPDFDDYR
jgi:antitoxin (DNA-binding transcriptional repressor) of toxin-antitoxin stability system